MRPGGPTLCTTTTEGGGTGTPFQSQMNAYLFGVRARPYWRAALILSRPHLYRGISTWYRVML